MIVRPVAAYGGIGGSSFGQRLFFELHIRLQVDGSGFHRFMAEPERDHGAVDTVVQEIHRKGVSKHVWGYVLVDQ